MGWPSGRVLASRAQGRGFNPRPSHTKDFENGMQCFPTWHSALRVRFRVSDAGQGKECCPPLSSGSSIERAALGSPLTVVDKLTYKQEHQTI